jgi:hypothetical protein
MKIPKVVLAILLLARLFVVGQTWADIVVIPTDQFEFAQLAKASHGRVQCTVSYHKDSGVTWQWTAVIFDGRPVVNLVLEDAQNQQTFGFEVFLRGAWQSFDALNDTYGQGAFSLLATSLLEHGGESALVDYVVCLEQMALVLEARTGENKGDQEK